jgi:hypothetical protein
MKHCYSKYTNKLITDKTILNFSFIVIWMASGFRNFVYARFSRLFDDSQQGFTGYASRRTADNVIVGIGYCKSDCGRMHGKTPQDLSFEEVDTVYQDITGHPLPLTPAKLKIVFDPVHMVESRKGIGGPQPASTRRMLKAHNDERDSQNAWVEREQQIMEQVENNLRSMVQSLSRN